MAIAEEFVAYLHQYGYDPRSSRHSDFLSRLIIRDLIERCPLIKRRALSGELVANLHHHQTVGTDDWQIDIAMGTCAGLAQPLSAQVIDHELPIRFSPPVIIQIAIELKGVITEHGKARRNRLRDFLAFLGHAYRYDPKTVVAAFLVVNSANWFYSPLNFGKVNRPELTKHFSAGRTGRDTAREAINLFRAIHLRHSAQDIPGLDGLGIIAIEHDNIALHPDPSKYAEFARPTAVAPTPPNPPLGDPLHYESMLQRICNAYSQRFA